MDLINSLCHTDLISFLTEQGKEYVVHAVLWAPDMTRQYLEEHEDELEWWLKKEDKYDIV